ncbi:MAG: DUF1735 domain-containing protein, partial [Proteobacteria bacterium]|nr:DUF1735 domain-containing protein [Pseudomonadota bacterium]
MKNNLYITLLITILVGISCENQEREFEDFGTTSVYFPVQFPVRTLALTENDRLDNSLDKNLTFNIGVSIGGMYENTKDWPVVFEHAPELLDTVTTLAGPYYDLMTTNYIESMNPDGNTVTIPAGSFSGLITVKLSNSFLDDSLAYTNSWIIPLKLPQYSKKQRIDSIAIIEENIELRVQEAINDPVSADTSDLAGIRARLSWLKNLSGDEISSSDYILHGIPAVGVE